MNVGHVEGGTNAGWRRVRPAHERWFCACFEVDVDDPNVAVAKLNPGYRGSCDDCGEKRPT